LGKRITRAADLPDWFNTSKYDKAVQLDARGWLKQLEFRQLCHDLVSYSSPEELENREPYGFKLVEFLSAIRTNPIFSADDSRFEQLIYDGIGDENYPIGQRAYPPGIFGITAYDIGDIILEWDSERQKEFMHWLEFRRAHNANPRKNLSSTNENSMGISTTGDRPHQTRSCRGDVSRSCSTAKF